jgi:hypothetical protein
VCQGGAVCGPVIARVNEDWIDGRADLRVVSLGATD